MTIEDGGTVSGLDKGLPASNSKFSSKMPYGAMYNWNGGAHGGVPNGNMSMTLNSGMCYGSILHPIAPGSGGSGDYANSRGGGIVRLDIGGALKLDGLITVEPGTKGEHYCFSGGSIWVNAATLSGTGTFDARGGSWNGGTCTGGGGGRIAIYLSQQKSTDADFAGEITVAGGAYRSVGATPTASGGTLYRQYADEKDGYGTCYIDGYNTSIGAPYGPEIGIPEARGGDGEKGLRNVRFVLRRNGRIFCAHDVRVGDIVIEDTTGRIAASNEVMTITEYDHKRGRGWATGATPSAAYSTAVKKYGAGDVRWYHRGMQIIVR